MSGAITPFTQYTFMAWCLVKKSTETTLPFTGKDLEVAVAHLKIIFWNWSGETEKNHVNMDNLVEYFRIQIGRRDEAPCG
jgi:hypothetical protein